MNVIKYTLLSLMFAIVPALQCAAKHVQAPQVYMFGFSASFQDSTVYFTDIQEVKQAWVDTKTKFLLGRDSYSSQLQNHLAQQMQQPNRVCITLFSTSQKNAQKQYDRLKKKYLVKQAGKYDVRYLSATDFQFELVDMSPQEGE